MGSTDKGFTKFPNSILDALLSSGLTRVQLLVLLYIVRKTYGWNKETDQISIERMTKDMGHSSRRWVSKAVNDLEKKGIIRSSSGGSGKPRFYSVAPPNMWLKPVSKSSHVTKPTRVEIDSPPESKLTHPPVADSTQVPESKLTHTKDSVQKTIKDEREKDDPFFSELEDGEEYDPVELLKRWDETHGAV